LSEDGKIVIERRNHPIKELAALIATVPEAISRSLKTLKEDRMIEYSRSKITVTDPQALADLAQLKPYITPNLEVDPIPSP
jgi:DNA-binding transcriptional regulator YhcF (GntR family)